MNRHKIAPEHLIRSRILVGELVQFISTDFKCIFIHVVTRAFNIRLYRNTSVSLRLSYSLRTLQLHYFEIFDVPNNT